MIDETLPAGRKMFGSAVARAPNPGPNEAPQCTPPPPPCSTRPPSPTAPSGWSRPRSAPAPMPRTLWRCARCRCRSRCATARWRKASAPKATISACACWSAAARRWSRPTIWRPTAVRALAERAVAMARAAPEDKFAGLADDSQLAHDFPDLDLIDPRTAVGRAARAECARRRSRGDGGQGRRQVGRRLGLGRHRRHGAGDQPRFPRRLSRLQPRRCR